MSPARFLSQQGSVEALLQGAAKGVFERSEKLGINQAVRDAMVEIRRNVSEAKSSMLANRDIFAEHGQGSAVQAVAVLDERNRQLAQVVDDVLKTLKELAGSDLEDQKKSIDSLNTATARLEVVKGFLEDSTMAVPENVSLLIQNGTSQDAKLATQGVDGQEQISKAEPSGATGIADQIQANGSGNPQTTTTSTSKAEPPKDALREAKVAALPPAIQIDPLMSGAATTTIESTRRPQAPNPTRSTIAQSSFAWMLEPDESAASPPSPPPKAKKKSNAPASSATNSHRKRPSANASRERTAFLFGDDPADEGGSREGIPEDLFGLKPLKKS